MLNQIYLKLKELKENIKDFSIIKIIIYLFLIGIIILIIISLYSDFKPIIFKKRIKSNRLSLFSEMYDNLLIYREKYTKTGKQTRYFKNGDFYIGNFTEGNYDIGFYYKNEKNDIYDTINDNIFVIMSRKVSDKSIKKGNYLLYYGKFKNNLFDEGTYLDIKNELIFMGKWVDNKPNGEGLIYFENGCYIKGIFDQNKLIEILSHNCSKLFYNSKLNLELNIEKIETKDNVDWNKTIIGDSFDKDICFFKDIIIRILWILYIIFITFFSKRIIKFLIKSLMNLRKKYIFNKNKKSYPNQIIIKNESYVGGIDTIDIIDSTKYNEKYKNTIYHIEYISSKGIMNGTGFFCKLKINDINLKINCLFTNYHVLKYVIGENINKIRLFNNNKEKIIEILINNDIIMFYSEKFDYFCLEVKDNNIIDFLEIDPNIFNNNYFNNTVYISGFHEKEISLKKGAGKIIEIDKNNIYFFYHNVNTEEGNSGSPVCKNNSYVIGIHKGYSETKQKNIGIFFKYILEDIKFKYAELIIKNQPIFIEKVGYFCELKSIDCRFLLIKYKTYIDLVINKNSLIYKTISNGNEHKIINLELNRFKFSCEKYQFAIIEILDEDNINIFFHFLDIDEQINIIKENKLAGISINESVNDYNNDDIIQKKDFFDFIKKYGNNFYQNFVGIKNYEKEAKKIHKCFVKVQILLNEFIEQIIDNFYFKIETKKYYPKFNILNAFRYFILLIIALTGLFLISFHIKRYFIYQGKKEEIKTLISNIINNKYAKYDIISDTKGNITLNIKKGIFNKINLDNKIKGQINYISIEKGSKIIGNCSELFRNFNNCIFIEIENLDTSEVTNMSYFFSNDVNLKYLNFSNFNTSKTANMKFMFYNCFNVTILDLSNFNTSKVKFMDYMFANCISLKKLIISSFDTKNVESTDYMFNGLKKLKVLNLSNFDTSNVKSMKGMFCSSMASSIDLSNFNTSQVINMEYMFYHCINLRRLNLSNFNTSKVINMASMFELCISLIYLNILNFDTSKVVSMINMFSNLRSLLILNLSNFNTSNVENMKGMFKYCFSIGKLNLDNFNTTKVTDMSYMFFLCKSLKKLSVKNFDTSNVIKMDKMFSDLYNLTILNISNFKTPNVKSMKQLFYYCIALEHLDLSNFMISPNANHDDIFNETNSFLKIKTNENNRYIIKKYEDYQKSRTKNNINKGIGEIIEDFFKILN